MSRPARPVSRPYRPSSRSSSAAVSASPGSLRGTISGLPSCSVCVRGSPRSVPAPEEVRRAADVAAREETACSPYRSARKAWSSAGVGWSNSSVLRRAPRRLSSALIARSMSNEVRPASVKLTCGSRRRPRTLSSRARGPVGAASRGSGAPAAAGRREPVPTAAAPVTGACGAVRVPATRRASSSTVSCSYRSAADSSVPYSTFRARARSIRKTESRPRSPKGRSGSISSAGMPRMSPRRDRTTSATSPGTRPADGSASATAGAASGATTGATTGAGAGAGRDVASAVTGCSVCVAVAAVRRTGASRTGARRGGDVVTGCSTVGVDKTVGQWRVVLIGKLGRRSRLGRSSRTGGKGAAPVTQAAASASAPGPWSPARASVFRGASDGPVEEGAAGGRRVAVPRWIPVPGRPSAAARRAATSSVRVAATTARRSRSSARAVRRVSATSRRSRSGRSRSASASRPA